MGTQRRLLPIFGAIALVLAFGMPRAAAPAAALSAVAPAAQDEATAQDAAATPVAQDSGPQVDPNSPAGTEYQLPTDRAREQAGGGRKSNGASGSSGDAAVEVPLFGAGVKDKTPPSAHRNSSGDSTTGGASRSAGTPTTTSPTTTAASEQPDLGASTPQTIRALAPAPDGGGGGMLAIGGGAAAVLLMGTLAGLAWRRRTTGS
jgi:hypothetical protein